MTRIQSASHFDSRQPHDGYLAGYDPFSAGDDFFLIEETYSDRWTQATFKGPDGEVAIHGSAAIRQAIKSLTEIADRAEARRGMKLEAA